VDCEFLGDFKRGVKSAISSGKEPKWLLYVYNALYKLNQGKTSMKKLLARLEKHGKRCIVGIENF